MQRWRAKGLCWRSAKIGIDTLLGQWTLTCADDAEGGHTNHPSAPSVSSVYKVFS